jgi:hypothetical protein
MIYDLRFTIYARRAGSNGMVGRMPWPDLGEWSTVNHKSS